ncbi:MAG: VWA domain-containing protein [Opitutales bacterium]|nr:VWA domain-containing protein [Opitutales bacterium]MDP4644737.1 VWA domain-containing protein [Opitutales bacterium]MDP4777442.1 VWA domain-containing protein [Opitutales bacterium]MDP4878765.1 VWA domain-containing protein [Opitutales bacterium]MDP5080379.1 VWA domain-containing protein [Opitutales bacterium]
MSFFQFQDPAYFLLLLALPLLAWWAGRMGPEAAVRFSSTALVKAVSHQRRSRAGKLLFALRLLALAALITALARPQFGKMNDTTDADGIDIVVTLDLSGSMRALDLSTREDVVTRLDAAKRVVESFIAKRPYDRIGIVAFASEAYVVSPLTLNHDWLKKNLQRLELGEIDGGGTAIGTAIGASVNRLRDHEARSRIVILLTDGENNAGAISPLGAAEAAKTYGVKIYTIATGKKGRVPAPETTREGVVIRDKDGRPIYRGNTMVSNYDETELTEIANMTGGLFFRATESGDLEKIYEEIDELEKTTIELRSYATFTELFIWPALIGLGLLFIEQVLRNTRYRRLP